MCDNIPFRSFRHKLSSFRALRAEEQSEDKTKEIVNQTDSDRRDNNDYNDNDGVVDNSFFAGPNNFFKFTDNVFEETFYSREKGRLFRSIFISHGKYLFLSLLRLFVERVFATEPAIFFHFKSVRIVLFVFHGSVVALFALSACQHYFDSHCGTS